MKNIENLKDSGIDVEVGCEGERGEGEGEFEAPEREDSAPETLMTEAYEKPVESGGLWALVDACQRVGKKHPWVAKSSQACLRIMHVADIALDLQVFTDLLLSEGAKMKPGYEDLGNVLAWLGFVSVILPFLALSVLLFSVFVASYVRDPSRNFSRTERLVLMGAYPFIAILGCLSADVLLATRFLLDDLENTKKLGFYSQLRSFCEAFIETPLQISIGIVIAVFSAEIPPLFWFAVAVSLVRSISSVSALFSEARVRGLSVREYVLVVINLGFGTLPFLGGIRKGKLKAAVYDGMDLTSKDIRQLGLAVKVSASLETLCANNLHINAKSGDKNTNASSGFGTPRVNRRHSQADAMSSPLYSKQISTLKEKEKQPEGSGSRLEEENAEKPEVQQDLTPSPSQPQTGPAVRFAGKEGEEGRQGEGEGEEDLEIGRTRRLSVDDSECCSRSHTLTRLELSGNAVSGNGLRHLLRSCRALKVLVVAGNRLGNAGGLLVAQGLEARCSESGLQALDHLDLSENSIQGDAAVAVAAAVAASGVRSLNLDRNFIGPQVTEQVVEALKVSRRLLSLGYSGNYVKDAGFAAFMRWVSLLAGGGDLGEGGVSVSVSVCLRRLDVSTNYITAASVPLLEAAVERWTSLESLCLRGNIVDEQTAGACASRLRQKQKGKTNPLPDISKAPQHPPPKNRTEKEKERERVDLSEMSRKSKAWEMLFGDDPAVSSSESKRAELKRQLLMPVEMCDALMTHEDQQDEEHGRLVDIVNDILACR
uniref:Uncharacterized protein n=1 Tax=Chromera velia CCMP2878 TaxID=1169474 RepID=A0A0G4IF56_9ALVE|eukprot:Cvel_13948.t1-p1 / transcript=Cvel_13948.t1 / gene=Cvel_13948 / organism=Chromera_velia_CCMP2878 / gene_product=hypothetical protein / transcript_product=hypothetical protein / location=Cvel_scaffold974:11388-15250(+) / protein_length=766 / sequence_SO=supercontig / SO=protein_coding / is_pseudo=false